MALTELSPDDLQAKYQAERDKRLRADATAQYRDLSEVFADVDRDPYSPPIERGPVAETPDVAIVGAGLGGLVAAARLAEAGVADVRIIDKAGDFGGTWYWNRYPGAACDIESYVYLPLLEETGYVPTEKYAKAPEIFAHCQRIARQFALYERALFQTEVVDLTWIDGDSRWRVTTDRGDVLMARFVIVAGGILHKAKLPGIPGIENFKGHSFHSSRWDYGYTGGSPTAPMNGLADKRVAIIGTGATAVQIVPRLAEAAGELLVFQRTPSSIGVRGNRPTDPDWAGALAPGWHKERIENFTSIVSGKPVERDLIADGWTEIFTRNPGALSLMNEEQQRLDAEGMAAIRARIAGIVEDEATATAMFPWYNQMCKRPCFHDDYLPAFNRANVRLVDTAGRGVDRITENGIVVDDVEYPVDCIVYASGFEVGGSHLRLLGFEIHGRDGETLTHAWAEGPQTLHGIHARGFPNLLRFSMTQGGIAINFAHVLGELAAHAAWTIARCLADGVTEIEATAAAQEEWFQTIMGNMGSQGMFFAQCTPSYMNGEGTREANMAMIRSMPFFGGTMEYLGILGAWREAGDMAGLHVTRAGDGAQAGGGTVAAQAAPDGLGLVLGSLAGRVAVVTGGASGIGAGIAEALATAGATVVVADLDGDAATRRVAAVEKAGGKAIAMPIDIGDEASVVAACGRIVAEHGVPWALVNNAAVQDRAYLLDLTADEWDRVLRINTRGPLLMIRELGRAMAAAGRGGRIVNIASMGVNGQLLRGHAAYATSKAALLGLTRTAAMELAPHAITVNTLLPGGVITQGAATSRGPAFEGPALRPPVLGMCEARDIAAAALFLVSPAARYVTNQALAVDAGWAIG